MAGAFVAGATGYTGGHVVRALRRQGIETVAHVRSASPRLEDIRVELHALGAKVDTTPWAKEALTATLARLQPEAVFALLGTTRARARRAAERGEQADYEAVDIGMTVMLLEACAAAGLRPRFVYLSAAGVREGARSPYYAARARTEARVRESGLPYTIARPMFIMGPDRPEPRPLELAVGRVLDGLLGLAGALGARRLRDTRRSISGEALGAALARLAFDPAAENETLERDEL